MPIDILRELTVLANDRPGLDTTAEFAAAWFAAKARLHEHLAAEPDHDSAREAALGLGPLTAVVADDTSYRCAPCR